MDIIFYDESSDFVENSQDNDFIVSNLTNIVSVTVNRNPTSDKEVTNKKYVKDCIEECTILRLNQTLKI